MYFPSLEAICGTSKSCKTANYSPDEFVRSIFRLQIFWSRILTCSSRKNDPRTMKFKFWISQCRYSTSGKPSVIWCLSRKRSLDCKILSVRSWAKRNKTIACKTRWETAASIRKIRAQDLEGESPLPPTQCWRASNPCVCELSPVNIDSGEMGKYCTHLILVLLKRVFTNLSTFS